jgi:hypothetical protein
LQKVRDGDPVKVYIIQEQGESAAKTPDQASEASSEGEV